MKREKNITLGIIFVVAAILTICNGFDLFEDINLWKIFISIFIVAWLAKGIKRKDIGSIIFPAVLLLVMYKDLIGLAISAGKLIWAAILAVIGFGFLSGSKNKQKNDNTDYIEYREINEENAERTVTDNTFTFSTSFGSDVKYVKADDFVKGNVNCSFGETKVYFDDAQIHCDEAVIYVNNMFGSINLYVPKEWYVTNATTILFGGVEEKNRSITNGNPKLRIVGNVSFGNVTVTYI